MDSLADKEAVVEYDYDAQHVDELTIRTGDVITQLKPTEPGWMQGCLRGKIGVFPDNFIKIVHRDSTMPRPKPPPDLNTGSLRTNGLSKRPGRRRCRALFSYTPEKSDELELKVNDIIDVIEEVEPGWWRGSINGKVGVFPSNFVGELPPPTDVIPQKDTNKLKSVKGVGVGELLRDGKPRLPAQQPVKPPDQTAVPDSPAPELPPKPVKEQCLVKFAYQRQNDDELTLKEGDVITLISKESEDKGWWRGELNGKVGVFPDNFVELLPGGERSLLDKPPGKPLPPKPEGLRDKMSGGAERRLEQQPPAAARGTTQALQSAGGAAAALAAAAGLAATAAAAAGRAVEEKSPPSKSPPLPSAPKPTSPKLVAPHTTSLPPPLPGPKPTSRLSPGPGTSTSPVRTEMAPAAAEVPPAAADKTDGSPSVEEFDAVERGTDKLTHITADRVKAPGRRPPSALFTRESMSPRTSPLVTPVSDEPAPIVETEEPALVNGTAGKEDAVTSAPTGTVSASQQLPWMKELQMAQTKRISRLAEPSAEAEEQQQSVTEAAPAETPGEQRTGRTAPAPAPWLMELQRNQAKKHQHDEGRASGDTGKAEDESDARTSQHPSSPPLSPKTKTEAHSAPDVCENTESDAGGADISGDQPPVSLHKPAGSSDPDHALLLQLREQCQLLRSQLDAQARQFNESLTSLKADYTKRMRTVLEELDAEKKARLVMQVQLDRLDKLVKDINFTV